MASVRHAVPVEAKSGASVVLGRDGAAAVFAPWRADAWVSKVRQLSGEEPAVLQAALDRVLRDLALHRDETAGLAAVHLLQALVLVSVGAQPIGAAGPAEQPSGAQEPSADSPSMRTLLTLGQSPPLASSAPASARRGEHTTTDDALVRRSTPRSAQPAGPADPAGGCSSALAPGQPTPAEAWPNQVPAARRGQGEDSAGT